jgi:hypothetical protein
MFPSKKRRIRMKLKRKKIIQRRESKRKRESDYPKTLKRLLKASKEIPSVGFQNGKEKGTKRKERRVQAKLKV